MVDCIIADAGPLIALGRVGCLDLLPKLFRKVIVPRPVQEECLAFPKKPGALAIAQAIQSSGFSVLDVNDSDTAANAFPSLGSGEIAAVRLALAMHAPVLMDDKLGRAFARYQGVAVIGIGGVLVAAKQAGYIAAAKPLLEQISHGGYHLSQALIVDILQRCSEAGESGE